MAHRIGRRVFLRTSAGAVLGLPFLPSLLSRDAQAAPGDTPRRFIAIQAYSGQFSTDYYPTWTPPGYELRDTAYGGPRADGTTALHETMPGTAYKWAPLSDFAEQGLSNVLTTALNPYLEKLLLLRGLDTLQETGHGFQFLGNMANCTYWEPFAERGLGQMPTIDQVLAYSDRFYPSAPKMRSLALGTGSTNTFAFSDYGLGGAVEQLSCYVEPRNVWQDLFGDFMPPDMAAEDPNRLLMNGIYQDYTHVRGHRRLSTEDRALLERHMAFLADIERELGTTPLLACGRPDEPPFLDIAYPWWEVSSIEDFQLRVSLLIDMAVAAIQCDLTRVVTLSAEMGITTAGGGAAVSFHQGDDVAGSWHDYAHDAVDEPGDHEHLVSLNRWVVEEVFAQFLARLDVEEAEGSTFLDNTLVYLGNELSQNHYTISLPTLLAGSPGGSLQTGHYVDYSQLDSVHANAGGMPWGVLIPGIPYNRLLVTILQAMGLSPADYERDGRPGYGHIEMFSGANYPEETYDLAQIGAPLPGIWNP